MASLLKIVLFPRKVKIPKNLKLLLFSETHMVRIYKNSIELSLQNKEYNLIRQMRFERGSILEVFSKLEFIVNELIQLRLIGYNLKQGLMLFDLLKVINFRSKIMILKKWKVISGNLKNKMWKAYDVRNAFAHLWSKNEVMYKKDFLKNNFEDFKNDMEEIWDELLKAYKIQQEKIDVDGIIESIKKMNPKKAWEDIL